MDSQTVSGQLPDPPGDLLNSEHVVLLDESGAAIGLAEKLGTHGADTPLHLAFSCYLFDDRERLLVTRRALHKRVFPGVWTNSVCGHPASGEPLESAVRRRARTELGIEVARLRVVLPAFRYRAQMDGIWENEICPVLVGWSAGPASPNPDEVAATTWVPWREYADEVMTGTRAVSPWSAMQVGALEALGPHPADWPDGDLGLLPPALRPLQGA